EWTELRNELRANGLTPPSPEKTKRIIELELFFNHILEQDRASRGRIMGLYDRIKERLEARHQQKIDALIKEMDLEIRRFSEGKPEYFCESNAINKNVELFEDEIWKIRQVFNRQADKIEKLCEHDPQAREKFKEAQDKFNRRARLWHEFREMGAAFPEEKKAELKELEASSYGEDRLNKFWQMEEVFKTIEQVEKEVEIEKKNAEEKERWFLYIKEMYPAMEADKRWFEEIQHDVKIAEFLNWQRNSLQLSQDGKSTNRSRGKIEKSTFPQKSEKEPVR
ncbi:MAG: hypothetical protein PHC81_03905, partial [Clostridia bacterium]|nr:hypothetical protein [Clostridia bacterium]